MTNSHTYALLVGINKYPTHLPPLEGCVNDLYAIKRFLFKRIPSEQLHIEVLKDQAATRANLVEKFEQHLGKAGKDDVALFYFSGYGSQEPAPELLGEGDPDYRNETLVCYDSRLPNGMDIADKELETLLGLVTERGAHVCVITDCSYSGDTTRALINDPPALFWPRTVPSAEQLRSLDSYILPRNYAIDRSAQISSDHLAPVPSPRYVGLHSAYAHEFAKEVIINGRKRGVFTYSLLEILQYCKGKVSYADVMRRVHSLVGQRTFDQTPYLHSSLAHDADMPFLNREFSESGEFYQLSFSGTKGWIIDGGRTQGLKEPSPDSSSTLLGVYAEEVADNHLVERLGQVAISQVFPEESTVVLNGVLHLNATQTYQARIEKTPSEPLGVCIRGDSAEGKLLARQVLTQEKLTSLTQEVSIREIAHFNLIAKLDLQKYTRKPGFSALPGYAITRASDRDDQPVVMYVEGFRLAQAELAVKYLQTLAWWKKVTELHNPGSRLPSEVASLQFISAESKEPLPGKEKNYTFSYFESDPNSSPPQFRLRLTHSHSEPLYCVLMYLSSDCGIQTQLLGEKGIWLKPGEEAWALGGEVFTARITDQQMAWGKEKAQERFKVIVANREFAIQHFNQTGIGGELEKESTKNPREIDVSPANQEEEEDFDWTSNELSLTLIRRD